MPKDSRSSSQSFDDIVAGRQGSSQPPARRSVRDRNTGNTGNAGETRRSRREAEVTKDKRFFNYPRAGKGPLARWLPSWRFLLGSFLTALILGVGGFLIAYAVLDVPEPEDVALAETTTVYYADGETVMGQFPGIRRTIIDTTELPDHVGNAIVASEDRRFYSNVGVDPIGIARAFINNITGGARQGGSTITQQYVERYYTGDNLGYVGKAKEAILALKIDRQQSKEEILGKYMNTIYFGRGANGIEQAAKEYFGKPAAELTVSESAMLAGIIPSPSNWDPAVNPDRAEQRWNRTLDLMVTSEFITQVERDQQVFPEVRDPGRVDTFGGPNGYILKTVEAELVNVAGFDAEDVATGGYRVVTTIDPRLQDAAVTAAENLPEGHAPNLRVGLVSLDNETGEIRAMYGGPDYLEKPFNAVTQGRAQAGSTYKVFTLLAALEQGYDLGKRYPSKSGMEVVPGWRPENADGSNRGNIDLVTATQHSVNTSYALLNVDVGPARANEVAVRLGAFESEEGLSTEPSNVLGSESPTVLNNARAFSTIANDGKKTTPHIVRTVERANGSTVYNGPTKSERVIDSQIAADATYAMTKVIDGGTAHRASVLGRPAAGKTGTSQHNKSAWFVGYVPQLTTAVALFQPGENGEEETITPFGGFSSIFGGSIPTIIWTEFMIEAVKDLPVEDFPSHSVIRPEPTPTPTEEEEEETEEEEEVEEEPEPTPEPTQEPTPTPTPTPQPTPEPTPEPSPEPTPDPEPEPDPTQGPPDPDAQGKIRHTPGWQRSSEVSSARP